MTTATRTLSDIQNAIRTIPDFPKPGIQFKDITPVLADPGLFAASVDLLIDQFKPGTVEAVVGIGFVPVRKKGKLPYQTYEQEYALEYGTSTIAIHADALKPGSRVLLIDDLLATGGTAAAAAALVQKLGATILEISFLIELKFLNGRARLKGHRVRSLVVY